MSLQSNFRKILGNIQRTYELSRKFFLSPLRKPWPFEFLVSEELFQCRMLHSTYMYFDQEALEMTDDLFKGQSVFPTQNYSLILGFPSVVTGIR